MADESERLEREAGQTRAQLSQTMGELRARQLSLRQPLDQLIASVRDGPVAEFGRNLVREVRDYPLPLLVIGIGIAWLMAAKSRSVREMTARAADAVTRRATEIGAATTRMLPTTEMTRMDQLIAWLRDAHAMEAATTDNLERLIARADQYPQLKTQMQRHLEVSRRQKDEIEQQLKALGSDTSTLKDMAMRLAGRLEPLLSGVTADDMPKHCIAAHSWEQFEIAAYRSMLGAAEELGVSELQQMCERFIREEQEMANVFFEQLPAITRQYLRGYATL
jgi:ferritin-like metal-binding protein YciE